MNKLRFPGAVCACLFIASAPQNATSGNLLSDINSFLTGEYPVATAYLDLFDPSGVLIDRQQMDATGLLSAGSVNTATEILFNGSLTFPDLYPLVAGDSGGFFASVHDFSIDLDTAYNSKFTDLVTMQIDWGIPNQSISETWNLNIGDDFVNFIAYNRYEQAYSSEALFYGSASFSLEFASGIAPVPLPAAVWLFGSGLLGFVGMAGRKAHS